MKKANQAVVKLSRVVKDQAARYVGSPPRPYTSFSRFTDDAYRILLKNLKEEKF